MNLRELLIVVGVVFIAGIVIDGFRRMRRAKKDSLEMSLGMGGEIENTPLDDGFNPELPNGGARTVSELESEQVKIEQAVATTAPNVSEERIEPSIGSVIVDEDSIDENLSSVRVVAREKIIEPREVPVVKQEKLQPKEKVTFGEGLKPESKKIKQTNAKKAQSKPEKRKVEQKKSSKPAQEVIILNVMSKSGTVFSGLELKELLEACGMEYGEMSIFHRHENTIDSPVQFSVANAVEPGYFPNDKVDTLVTPGISFFMSLPGPDENMRAFDYMVETAQCVVNNLSGEMKDERRSDMTPQTLEHCRQRIRDFERRQLTARC